MVPLINMISSGPPGFNEAPIHESGKCLSDRQINLRHTGFNEAPIHESGKFSGVSAILNRSSGFNEAPIHESGKSGWIDRQRNPTCPLQ